MNLSMLSLATKGAFMAGAGVGFRQRTREAIVSGDEFRVLLNVTAK